MNKSSVTVLMPVYNGEKFLREAIDSVLAQDHADFELIIVNDGSTDGSLDIITSYPPIDPRVKIINNHQNLGLVKSLNLGLAACTTTYLARMDCDDVCRPDRISKQVKFMDKHPDIGACGGYYDLVRNGKKVTADFPLGKDEIGAFLLFNSPMAHPTVMIRMAVIDKNDLSYNSAFIHCEDYQLWTEIYKHSGLGNIPDVLLDYRVHENQITGNEKFISAKSRSLDMIRRRNLEELGLKPTEKEMDLHHKISNGEKAATEEELKAGEKWLTKIMDQNLASKKVHQNYLEKIILERWLRFCYNYLGWKKGFGYFYRSGLYKRIKLPVSLKLALFRQVFNAYKRKG